MQIPISKPFIDDEIKQKILDVIDSGYYILGENCKKLELEFSKYIGTSKSILTSSGTSALSLALLALGIKDNDEVIVPSHTAFPTIESIFHNNAIPVFVDINKDTYTIDPEKIKISITPRTKAIIPVHLYGHPVDIDPIIELAERHNLKVIEDCCQAHGAEYKGKKVGSISDIGCFSFYPSKNMTVYGDGGIAVTNNEMIAEKIKMLRNHGRKEKYTHELIGFNLRFNEIQAAVGLIQLKKLDSFNEKRRKNAKLYSESLGETELITPIEAEWAKHVYHQYVIRCNKRNKLQAFLKENGIATDIHYPIPCHLQPALRANIKNKVKLEITEKIANEILSLPMFPELKEEEIFYIINKIKKFYK